MVCSTPFGFAGRAGGIQDKQRVLGVHFFRRAVGGDALGQLMPPQIAPFLPVTRFPGALEHHHVSHADHAGVFQRIIDVLFSGTARPARRPSSAVITSLALESIMRPATASGEAAEDHRMYGADTRASQHCDRRFRHHWHIDGHHVAFFTPSFFSTLANWQTSWCSCL